MKSDLRIFIKDHRREKNLKVILSRTPFGTRQFFVRMNGQVWPPSGRPVSLTRVLTLCAKRSSGRRWQGVESPPGAGEAVSPQPHAAVPLEEKKPGSEDRCVMRLNWGAVADM